MAKPLLRVCSIPNVGMRDGMPGASGTIYLPFYGYYRVDGGVMTWPQESGRPQDESLAIRGVSSPNTYQKDCCTCSGEGEDLWRGRWPRNE